MYMLCQDFTKDVQLINVKQFKTRQVTIKFIYKVMNEKQVCFIAKNDNH